MGRVGNETQPQPHQGLEFQEIHQNTIDDPPPPPQEEDLYGPPADYQPPPPTTTKSTPPKPTPQVVHNFPPLQDDDYDMPPPPPNKPQVVHNFPPLQVQDHGMPMPQQPAAFPQNQYFPQQQQHQQQQQGINPMIIANSPFMHMPQQNQPWKSNLFDCTKNPQNALITLCFPCVTFGQIAEVLDNGSTTCATSGILYTCIALCIAMPCLMSCGYRSKLRAKFGLVESPASDFLIHCFCEYCALCQEYRELEDRGFDPSIGHAGNMAKQQRQQQQFGFTPPMQQRMMM